MSESVVTKINKRPIGKKPFYVWATCDKDNKDVKFIINTNADLAKCLGIGLPKGQIDILGLCRNNGYTVLAILDDNDSVLYKKKITGVEVLSENKMPSKELATSEKVVSSIGSDSSVDTSVSHVDIVKNVSNGNNVKMYKNTGNRKVNIIVVLLGATVLIGSYGIFSKHSFLNRPHSLNTSVDIKKVAPVNSSSNSAPKFPEIKDDTSVVSKDSPVSSEPHDMTHADVQKQDEELKKKMNIQTSEPIWDKKLFNNTQNWHPNN